MRRGGIGGSGGYQALEGYHSVAVFLISTTGEAAGQRWPLRRGTLRLGSSEGCEVRLTSPGIAAEHARLEIAKSGVQLAPEPGCAVTVNGETIFGVTKLRPDDTIGLGSVALTIRNEVEPAPVAPPVQATPAAPTTSAADPVGVALPPPDPPKWRILIPIFAILASAAVVTLVIRLVPQRLTAEEQMPKEVRQQVETSTVWIRASIPEGESEGSGFVSANGYVLTNAHVVEGGQQIAVVFNTGTNQVRRVPATLIKIGHPGQRDDIALLKVPTPNIQPLKLVEPTALTEGNPLLAFGYPLGSLVSTSNRGPQISIRRGDLTALRRNNAGKVEWIESDVLAEVGNSGGPVVTIEGKVVGLATMLVGPNLRTARIVPSSLLKSFAPQAVVD